MATKPKRGRTERRENERAGVKLAEQRLKLASLEAGGQPTRPIEVTSASVIEPQAASLGCAACGGTVRVEEHAATNHSPDGGPAVSLRVVRVRCVRCGVARNVYFRIRSPLPN